MNGNYHAQSLLVLDFCPLRVRKTISDRAKLKMQTLLGIPWPTIEEFAHTFSFTEYERDAEPEIPGLFRLKEAFEEIDINVWSNAFVVVIAEANIHISTLISFLLAKKMDEPPFFMFVNKYGAHYMYDTENLRHFRGETQREES